ncbi:MAG: hypothetical protein ACJ75B_09325 [Flavisolibacter sp.]
MKKSPTQNTLRITAIVFLFIVSLNALAAGYSFITDPSGKGLGITTDYLKSSTPFDNYFIPGIVLFVVIGIMSSVIAVFAMAKREHYPFLILTQGCILVGWIAIQLMMVTTFHPLHLIIGLIGVLLMFFGWLINQKRLTW